MQKKDVFICECVCCNLSWPHFYHAVAFSCNMACFSTRPLKSIINVIGHSKPIIRRKWKKNRRYTAFFRFAYSMLFMV